MSLLPSAVLSKGLERSTNKLKTDLDFIEEIDSAIKDSFEGLKKSNTELTKLAVQATRFKEKKPRLKDLYKQKEEAISKINKSISFDAARLFNKIDTAIKILQRIIFNADASLYKEDKRLNKFINKIEKLKDEKLSQTLLNKIELVKEDIKTAARRLYEASRAEEKEVLKKYPSEMPQKISVSEEIKGLSIEAADLEDALKHLTITNIDQIFENAEKLLRDLKKIELDAISVMPKLEESFIKTNALLYLLENQTRSEIKKRLNSSKEAVSVIKKRITEHAKNLLKDIEIVKKIKS